MNGTSENDIAFGVLQIANAHPKGIATFKRLYQEIPRVVTLNNVDWRPSQTRKGESMWHQIVRNIKSHYNITGNYINIGYLIHVPRVGYKITDDGRRYLKSKGY